MYAVRLCPVKVMNPCIFIYIERNISPPVRDVTVRIQGTGYFSPLVSKVRVTGLGIVFPVSRAVRVTGIGIVSPPVSMACQGHGTW